MPAQSYSPEQAVLPDSPGASLDQPPKSDPCIAQHLAENPEASSASAVQKPCNPADDKYARFVNGPAPTPMTPRQKGRLAIHDVVDPFNIVTIFLNSGFTVAINSHTAYGPGIKGFGRDAGYSFVQDATGEAIGTWAVCSLFHQDPRYHRMPDATVMRRLAHALSHAVVAQHDDGRLMPNYENLITYPASAEIANLYVPGVATNFPSTVERVLVGLATEPVDNIITEFLPDVAKRIHVRVVFVQQIIDKVATNQQF
jgi:hypothetical protein